MGESVLGDHRAGPRLAIDIGGTFTDVVLTSAAGTASLKVLTTPAAPERGVLDGVGQILRDANVAPTAVTLVIHGTTLATNALIERKGATTALLTTEGFRDSVEMAYEHRFEQYDLYMERPSPLVPRHLRFGITERVAADGDVLLPLNETDVRAVVPILKEHGVESVAIGFLHSYTVASHEQRTAQLLNEAMPGLSVTLSSEVCPEIREYERLSTACANAYVQPLMAGYLNALNDGLTRLGVGCPLLMMMSSGGMTTVETAVRQPIRLIESGPAGGVILAQEVAAQAGAVRALSFDMGGTTAKLTLIDDLEPQHSRTFEVARQYRFLKGSGLPVRIPVIDMVEIGAGGGSIARVDDLRRINVGPDSAGAMPGPACYGQGGDDATVTDADLVLGRIDPDEFASSKIRLDAERAAAAVHAHVGSSLSLTAQQSAAGIVELVGETMASAARVHAVENGKDTAGRTLIATGGAAPLHAARLAEKLGINEVIIPVDAGVGSAHGFLCAPISYEVVRTQFMRLDVFDAAHVNALFARMRAEAEAVVRLGAPQSHLLERREAFMRYRGQGHEITVTLPHGASFDDESRDRLQARFEAQYRQVFGRIIPRLEVEIVTWALTLTTARNLPTPLESTTDSPATGPVVTAATQTRVVFDPALEASAEAEVYERGSLAVGASIDGPALVTEAQTTTVVPSGFTLRVNQARQLILRRLEMKA
jgi:N-methylhydantoinase A